MIQARHLVAACCMAYLIPLTAHALPIDVIGEIASGIRSGDNSKLITGTAGTNTHCAQWEDGDLVTTGATCGIGDTGPIPDCAGTELQDAAGTCVTDLAELNTSLSTGLVTGAHTAVGGADTNVQYNDSGALSGSNNLTFADVADHEWTAPVADVHVGDADEGMIEIGSAFIGQADETISGVVLDDVFFIVNMTDSASDLGAVFISKTGVARFAIPEEGDDLATWNPRSMVIGPAATAATMDEGIHCVDAPSSIFSIIDCDTDGTGADLGVQDDVEVLGTVYVGEAVQVEAHATEGGSVRILEGQDDGTNYFELKVPDSGLTGDETCTLEANGKIPPSCIATEVFTWCHTHGDVSGAPITANDHHDDYYRAPADITVTEIWCITDTGTFEMNVENVSTDIMGSDLVCDDGGEVDSSPSGDVTVSDGDTLSMKVTSTASTPHTITWCVEYTRD